MAHATPDANGTRETSAVTERRARARHGARPGYATRGTALLLTALALAALPGCRKSTKIRLVLQGERPAEVRVLGLEPKIRIENGGPGDVAFRVECPDPRQRARGSLGHGHFTSRYKGPVTLELRTDPTTYANVEVRAWHADGMSLDYPARGDVPKKEGEAANDGDAAARESSDTAPEGSKDSTPSAPADDEGGR